MNSIEARFRELYKQKKKFSWNWFTSNKNKQDQTPKDKLSELETLQFSLIEYYFLIGAFDLALSELKNLSETLTVTLTRKGAATSRWRSWSFTSTSPS